MFSKSHVVPWRAPSTNLKAGAGQVVKSEDDQFVCKICKNWLLCVAILASGWIAMIGYAYFAL